MPSFILLLLVLVIFLGAFGYMTISYHRTDAERRAGEKKPPVHSELGSE
jgi:heme/copper-type cytochrome/quinol oxidase subunit 2